MDLVHLQLVLDLCNQDMERVDIPFSNTCEHFYRVGLERPLEELHPEPPTKLFQCLVSRPSTEGNHPLYKLYVLEPGLFEHGRELGRDIEAQGFAEPAELGQPRRGGAFFAQRAVVAPEVGAALGQLDVAAGLAVLEARLDDGGPVLDCAGKGAPVDEVEVVWGKGPRQGGIVDLKLDVGRDPGVVESEYSAKGVGSVRRVDKGRCTNH